jgi:hypothetical protein
VSVDQFTSKSQRLEIERRRGREEEKRKRYEENEG